jgi:Flp pilus assembly protein TadG
MQAARRFVWRFAEFSQREHGSVAIIFALAIVPILLAAGGGH